MTEVPFSKDLKVPPQKPWQPFPRELPLNLNAMQNEHHPTSVFEQPFVMGGRHLSLRLVYWPQQAAFKSSVEEHIKPAPFPFSPINPITPIDIFQQFPWEIQIVDLDRAQGPWSTRYEVSLIDEYQYEGIIETDESTSSKEGLFDKEGKPKRPLFKDAFLDTEHRDFRELLSDICITFYPFVQESEPDQFIFPEF